MCFVALLIGTEPLTLLLKEVMTLKCFKSGKGNWFIQVRYNTENKKANPFADNP